MHVCLEKSITGARVEVFKAAKEKESQVAIIIFVKNKGCVNKCPY